MTAGTAKESRGVGLRIKRRFFIVWVAMEVLVGGFFPASPVAGQDAAGEGGCRFPDVPATSPAHADITYACRQGWFTGYPDGSFRPDRPVPAHQIATVVGRAFAAGATRADMATFLRGGRPGDPARPAGFADIPATHPQNRDIAYAVEQAWFQGYPDGSFRPNRVITATQITTVLQRAFPTASTRAQLATSMRHGQQALNANNDSQPRPSPSKIAYEVPVYDSLGENVARELWVADTDGSAARRLTDDVRYYHSENYESQFGDWEWSPGGEGIAYRVTVRDFRGNEMGSELWVAGADSSVPRQLTDKVFYGDGYGWEWSPNGERIAYNVPEWNSYGVWVKEELWVAMADGSGARRLVDNVGHRWEWSPDGERIVYSVVAERNSYGNIMREELWVVDVDGSYVHRLTPEISIRGWQWSPDGERIAFTLSEHDFSLAQEVAKELWMASVDGSDTRRLTDDVGITKVINRMWWSPDGERIIYEIKEFSLDEEEVSELWVVGVDGSRPRRLTEDFAYNWGFSPSGETIAYQSRIWEFGRWLGYGLWAADADGSNQRQIGDDIAYWSWSPSKETIAYWAKKRDPRRTVINTELWVSSADGSSTRKLTDDVSEGEWIDGWWWSPDGESIFYWVRVGDSSDNDRELWVASADGSGARPLADYDYGWRSPDGERIAYGVKRDSNGEGGELWVAGVDGTSASRLVKDVAISEEGWLRWTWSDGESFFYEVDVDSSGGKRELWVVGIDGSSARRLTDDVALNEWGSRRWGWSPSEEKFVYGVTVRDSRGNEISTELWVAEAAGSRARKIADDVNDLRWQPGGS